MHCIHCGELLPDTAKFCPSCGQRVQAAPQPTVSEPEPTVSEPAAAPQEEAPQADAQVYGAPADAPLSSPAPVQGYGPAAPGYAAPAPVSSNDLAIAGFICSLILIPVLPIGIVSSILGLILSLVGLSKSKQLPERKGRGLAIAGTIISAIRIALRIIFVVAMIAFLVNGAGYAGQNLINNWPDVMPYTF